MNALPQSCFDLIDHHGREVKSEHYLGRYLLVYFGFTHCRVVCPRALGKLSAVLEQLGSKAGTVVPLYITVDPVRDTPAVMQAYLRGHYPRFTGLSGTEAQIAAAKQSFRVFAQRQPDAEDADGYVVPHSAIAYLIGPDGAYRAHFTDSLSEDTIIERMAAILGEAPSRSELLDKRPEGLR